MRLQDRTPAEFRSLVLWKVQALATVPLWRIIVVGRSILASDNMYVRQQAVLVQWVVS